MRIRKRGAAFTQGRRGHPRLYLWGLPWDAVRTYYFGGPWSGVNAMPYSWAGWSGYAAKAGIGCTPGTAVKGGDGILYRCQ